MSKITTTLSERDVQLLDKLIMDEKRNERFIVELKLMKQKNYKSEIQSLNNISFNFISGVYLKTKLLKRLYLWFKNEKNQEINFDNFPEIVQETIYWEDNQLWN